MAYSAGQWALPPISVGTLRLKSILVPVDFTECSQKAVTYAVSLAKHFHSKIILLHITRMAVPMPSPELVAVQSDVSINRRVEDSARRAWPSGVNQVAAHVPARALVRQRRPHSRGNCRNRAQTKCDLIVLGTHAKGALEHLFSSNVAEKVVHHARCPVLVVRAREHDFIRVANSPAPDARRSPPDLNRPAASNRLDHAGGRRYPHRLRHAALRRFPRMKILCVHAHFDDFEFAAAGTFELWRRKLGPSAPGARHRLHRWPRRPSIPHPRGNWPAPFAGTGGLRPHWRL